jgi:ATPase subunit of ABC transporter with duplicated ATPase domains
VWRSSVITGASSAAPADGVTGEANASILEVDDLRVSYGGNNGAGKSTLLRAISGRVR